MGLKRLLATAAAAALLTTGPLSAAAPAQEGPPAVLTGAGTGLVDSTLPSSTDAGDTDAVSQGLDGADTALPVVLAVILAATAVGIRRVVSPEEPEEKART